MTLRIAPPSSHPTTRTTPSSSTAPSAPGLHDTLRANLSLNAAAPSTTTTTTTSAGQQPQSTHPLESRLAAWQSTQESLKMNLLRRQFGMGEPLRRGMELKICREGEWRPACLGGSSRVGEEVLSGRGETVEWEDVYPGGVEGGNCGDGGEGGCQMEVERWVQW